MSLCSTVVLDLSCFGKLSRSLNGSGCPSPANRCPLHDTGPSVIIPGGLLVSQAAEFRLRGLFVQREQISARALQWWPRVMTLKMGRRVGRQALTMPMQFSTIAQIAGSTSFPERLVSALSIVLGTVLGERTGCVDERQLV